MEHEVNPNEAPKRKRGRPKKIKPDELRTPLREALREDDNFVYKLDGPDRH
jgi:hypothetical protein